MSWILRSYHFAAMVVVCIMFMQFAVLTRGMAEKEVLVRVLFSYFIGALCHSAVALLLSPQTIKQKKKGCVAKPHWTAED